MADFTRTARITAAHANKVSAAINMLNKHEGFALTFIAEPVMVKIDGAFFELHDVTVSGNVPDTQAVLVGIITEDIQNGKARIYTKVRDYFASDYFRMVPLGCDYCGTNHRRTKVFAINDDGLPKMAGSSCVKAATGLDSMIADSFVALVENIDEFENESLGGFNKNNACYSVRHLVAAALMVCEKTGGYVSKARAEESIYSNNPLIATGLDVKDYLFKDTPAYRAENIDQKYFDRADTIISAIKADGSNSEWIMNLKSCFSMEHAHADRIGLIASAAAYKIKSDEPEMESNWIPADTMKKGVSVKIKTINQNSGMYVSFMVIMQEIGTGNIIKWNSSNLPSFNVGDTVKISGTVKQNGEYRGQKQTIITRAKVIA